MAPRPRAIRRKKGRYNWCISYFQPVRTSNTNQTFASGKAGWANSNPESLCFWWKKHNLLPLCRAEALLNYLIGEQFVITWSTEFFDRQHFSKHWSHGEITKEILGGKNSGNHSEKESNMDLTLCFLLCWKNWYHPQKIPRLMRKKWASPLEGSSNATENEKDSNMWVQTRNVSARSRRNWKGVNLSACFLLFTMLVLSFSTYHLSLLWIHV